MASQAQQAGAKLPATIRNNVVVLVLLWCAYPLFAAYIERGAGAALLMAALYLPAPLMLAAGFFTATRATRWRFSNFAALFAFCFVWGILGMCFGWMYGAVYGMFWTRYISTLEDWVAAGLAYIVVWALWTGALGWISGVLLAAQQFSRKARPDGCLGRFFEYQTSEMVSGVVSTVSQVPYATALAAVLLMASRALPSDSLIWVGIVLGVVTGIVHGRAIEFIASRVLSGAHPDQTAAAPALATATATPALPTPAPTQSTAQPIGFDWVALGLTLFGIALWIGEGAIIGAFLAQLFTNLPEGKVILPFDAPVAKEVIIFDPEGTTAQRFGPTAALILGAGFYVGLFGAVVDVARQTIERIVRSVAPIFR